MDKVRASEWSWMINLLIADSLARKYNLNREAAINRCARRMRDQCLSERGRNYARSIIAAPLKVKAGLVVQLFSQLEQEGMV